MNKEMKSRDWTRVGAWALVGYLAFISLPMRSMRGIVTESDAVLATVVGGIGWAFIGLLAGLIITGLSKERTKSGIPFVSIDTKFSVFALLSIVFSLLIKAVSPSSLFSLIGMFATYAVATRRVQIS